MSSPFNFLGVKIDAGERIFEHNAAEDKIYLKPNKPYLMLWGVLFLCVPVLFGKLFLLTEQGFNTHHMMYVIFLLASLPFVIYGIGYVKAAKSNTIVTFDLKLRTLSLSKEQVFPFELISCFQLSHLVSASGKNEDKSYQLSAILFSHHEITLLSSHNYESIKQSADHLSKMTGINIDPKVVPA